MASARSTVVLQTPSVRQKDLQPLEACCLLSLLPHIHLPVQVEKCQDSKQGESKRETHKRNSLNYLVMIGWF